MPKLLYALLVCVIGLVSLYDAYLSLKFQDVMWQTEQNPVGRWLIEQDDGGVTLLVAAKLTGTAFVLLTLRALYQLKPRWGWMTASTLASFQLCLLFYLTYG